MRSFTNVTAREWLPSYLVSQPNPSIERGLVFDQAGLVKGWDGLHKFTEEEERKLSRKDRMKLKTLKETHPIEVLVERGLKKWNDLLAR